MTVFDLIFLVPLFFIGTICALTDIKYGKIKNKWIGWGLVWALFLYSYMAVDIILSLPETQNLPHLFSTLLNGVLAAIVSFLMWRFKLWAAGDAKLFTFFALLIPLKFYSSSYIDYFPSFNLIVNTFFLIILFLIAEASLFGLREGLRLARHPKKIKKAPWREWLNPQKLKWKALEMAKIYLVYLVILIGIRLLTRAMGDFFTQYISPSDFVLIILVLFVLRRFLFKFLLRSKIIMLAIVGLICWYSFHLISAGQTDVLLNIFKTALIFMIVILTLIKLIEWYIEKKETRSVKPGNLKENMIVLPSELSKVSQEFGEKNFKKKFGSSYQDGLSKLQIDFLKKNLPEGSEIKIYKTFTFAPFMLTACLATIAVKGSLVAFLLKSLLR